jgi:1,4-dihydroxy-2-naphthoate octaprenyltransferase
MRSSIDHLSRGGVRYDRSMNIDRIVAFIKLGRPLFLVGGVVLHAVGVAVALYNGVPFKPAALLWGQVAITAVQWMTHYANDYFDLAADRANRTPTNWSGGSRVLADNRLPPRAALVAALGLAGIALLAGCVLTFGVGTGALTLPLIGLALVLAWCYSAPPIRLHSRGVGELTSAILVTGLVPVVGYYLQAGQLDPPLFQAIFPLACLQFCMLLSVEFPDVDSDRETGKRNLVVRLGAERASWLYIGVLTLPYASMPLLWMAHLPTLVALVIYLMFPLAVYLLRRAGHGDYADPARWNLLAFYSIALLIGTAAVEAFAFVLLSGI